MMEGRFSLRAGMVAAAVLTLSFLSGAETATPRNDPYLSRREVMVREQIELREVRNEAVLAAMRTVPRHEFVPPSLVERAYADSPLPIGHGQTISQPYIVAAMTEMLHLTDDAVVLEIGTGSGYQAAVLSPIAKKVYSIEIVEELGKSASERLQRLHYDNVEVRVGDGYYGWAEHAPFDGIIVTAAASHIPPPLIEQLRPGGRMVVPVGPPMMVQHLMLVEKREDGSIQQRDLMPVRFVPLTGGKGGE